jgi:membrane associated rhomboid family serine protease
VPDSTINTSRSPRLLAGNYAIMLVATCAFAVQMLVDPQARYLSGLILEKWNLPGLLGHMWLHMTMLHLVTNLITLWIFGRYVCPLLGNVPYALAYVIVGMAAGMVHVVLDGRPALGASGAIMGIFGMHVVICFRQFGRLGPWLVFTWFVATLGAGIIGGIPDAYFDHAGGFLCGMLLAFCLVLFRFVKLDDTDPALVTLLRRLSPRRHRRTLDAP